MVLIGFDHLEGVTSSYRAQQIEKGHTVAIVFLFNLPAGFRKAYPACL